MNVIELQQKRDSFPHVAQLGQTYIHQSARGNRFICRSYDLAWIRVRQAAVALVSKSFHEIKFSSAAVFCGGAHWASFEYNCGLADPSKLSATAVLAICDALCLLACNGIYVLNFSKYNVSYVNRSIYLMVDHALLRGEVLPRKGNYYIHPDGDVLADSCRDCLFQSLSRTLGRFATVSLKPTCAASPWCWSRAPKTSKVHEYCLVLTMLRKRWPDRVRNLARKGLRSSIEKLEYTTTCHLSNIK